MITKKIKKSALYSTMVAMIVIFTKRLNVYAKDKK